MASQHQHDGHNHGEHADYYSRRAEAIQALLIEKGVCSLDEILTQADQIDSRTPEDGARIVAKAWVDPEFKKRLIADPLSAIQEVGVALAETAPRLRVLENTDKVHHLGVCTLCSCFPRAVIGRPCSRPNSTHQPASRPAKIPALPPYPPPGLLRGADQRGGDRAEHRAPTPA